MPDKRVETLRKKISTVWAGEDESRAACLALFDYLSENVDTSVHITHHFLVRIGERANVKDEIKMLEAAQYLSGPNVGLLEMWFEFIDENDGLFREPFSLEDVNRFLQKEEFINPFTGLKESNFSTKMYLFFCASAAAKDIFGAKR